MYMYVFVYSAVWDRYSDLVILWMHDKPLFSELWNSVNLQARLHEIITCEAKTVNCNESAEFPWMVDGAGLPANASQLLPKMVFFFFWSYHLFIIIYQFRSLLSEALSHCWYFVSLVNIYIEFRGTLKCMVNILAPFGSIYELNVYQIMYKHTLKSFKFNIFGACI